MVFFFFRFRAVSDRVGPSLRQRGRVDGVSTTSRHRDAIDATREGTDSLKTVSINAGLFYEGLVVASRQGAPLSEPPSYGEASPALEHLVLYDDGSSEWFTLKNEKVRYVQSHEQRTNWSARSPLYPPTTTWTGSRRPSRPKLWAS